MDRKEEKMSLLDILSGLLSVAVLVISYLQWHLAKRKRKDDLFKLRYEFYKKITEYIKDASLIDHTKGYEYPFEVFWEYHIEFVENIIIEAKFLFGINIANYLREYMDDSNLKSTFKKCKLQHEGDFPWIPPLEFTKQFEKYLTLK